MGEHRGFGASSWHCIQPGHSPPIELAAISVAPPVNGILRRTLPKSVPAQWLERYLSTTPGSLNAGSLWHRNKQDRCACCVWLAARSLHGIHESGMAATQKYVKGGAPPVWSSSGEGVLLQEEGTSTLTPGGGDDREGCSETRADLEQVEVVACGPERGEGSR